MAVCPPLTPVVFGVGTGNIGTPVPLPTGTLTALTGPAGYNGVGTTVAVDTGTGLTVV